MKKLLVLGMLLLATVTAKADIISEFGGGYKTQMSQVMNDQCHYVQIVEADNGFKFDLQGRVKTTPCGGSQPIFVGWPIAWENEIGNVRVGWFHMSHYRTGPPFNHDPEISFNCICATYKIDWTHRHGR